MTAREVVVDGKRLQLGRLVGRGGEGDVYSIVGNESQAVKIYTTPDRLTRAAKVAAIVRSGLAEKSPLVAFPTAVAWASDGSFAGFVMRLVTGCRPLHELYAPGSRKQNFPQADYRFIARAASNIAKAFASVHATGCVIGDINHSGILVSSTATAVLIDADSFQITDGREQHLCSVGVPEYTPPELQGKPLKGIVRSTDHDAFGLAIVMFQVLLMGRHPFVGTVRKGEIPPLQENIAQFRYVYTDTRNVGMDQPPGTPNLPDFSPELAALFERAFSRSGIGRRPTAHEWVATLDALEGSLAKCEDNPLHFGPKGASECAWCEMERQFGTVLFLPFQHDPLAASGSVGFSSAALEVEVIWARIQRIVVPSRSQLSPILQTATPQPTEAAQLARAPRALGRTVAGVAVVAVAVFLLVSAPGAWFLSLLIAVAGASLVNSSSAQPVKGEPFIKEFVDAQQQWYRELEAWYRKLGLDDLDRLKIDLTATHHRLVEIKAEESRQIADYRANRKARHLDQYLEAFDISKATVKGLGPSKLAALASYGIDTAADLSYGRLFAVPGFGDVLISRLLEWRRGCESRFVYNPNENSADAQEFGRLKAHAATQAAPHRQALMQGLQSIEPRWRHLEALSKLPDQTLQKSHERLAQVTVNLDHLRIARPKMPAPPTPARRPSPMSSPAASARGNFAAPPAVSRPTQAQPSHPPAQSWRALTPSSPAPRPIAIGPTFAGVRAPVAPAPQVVTSAPTCPRCSSQMMKRLARRGRNAGSYFWGCARYPGCKGTRPI